MQVTFKINIHHTLIMYQQTEHQNVFLWCRNQNKSNQINKLIKKPITVLQNILLNILCNLKLIINKCNKGKGKNN